jgi:tetratricopeptide (TPR) repeat protein
VACALGLEDAEVVALQARVDEAHGAWEAVLFHAQKVLRLQPQNPAAQRCLAHAYQALGDEEKALKAYDAAIAADPADWHTYMDRAALHVDKKRMAAADADTTQAIQRNPVCARAYALRAYCRLRQSKFNSAQEDCDAALKLDPKQVMATLVRARVLAAKLDFTTAIAECEGVLKLSPEWDWALVSYGYVLRLAGQPDKAVTALTRAIRLSPAGAEGYVERGLSQMALRHYQLASDDLDHAIALDPGLKATLSSELNDLKSKLANP